jgi:hypothetical protein
MTQISDITTNENYYNKQIAKVDNEKIPSVLKTTLHANKPYAQRKIQR